MTKKKEILFKPEPLTKCTVYKLTRTEPFFLDNCEEGNIAYYGLILQSEYDAEILEYLLESARNNLWEYHEGYGITSADSALVLEGLMESGVDNSVLERSLDELVNLYYDRNKGAFKTVLRERSNYWEGVSVETTAHVAYLLYRVNPDKYSSEIEGSAGYLKNKQNPQGLVWTGKWFPSVLIPTYYSLRFLQCLDGYEDNVERAISYITSSQNDDGGWQNSLIDASCALLALKNVSGYEKIKQHGKEFLLSREIEGRWEGETVLYYWFEER